jgi:hypothetical protein
MPVIERIACCLCGRVVPKTKAREVKLYDTESGSVFGWECARHG